MFDGFRIAVCDVALFGDLDGGVSGTAAAPGEVDEEEAEDAENDLRESFAKLVFELEDLVRGQDF